MEKKEENEHYKVIHDYLTNMQKELNKIVAEKEESGEEELSDLIGKLPLSGK